VTATEWITQFLLGGLFGSLGQGLRVVVGLKKLNDRALQAGRPFNELFKPSSLIVSLLIGFIAGVLGMLTANLNLQAITRENILLLVGIGYTGADFIEGFVRKTLPSGSSAPLAPSPLSGLAVTKMAPAAPLPADEPQPPVG
jgi:hypothetical protein